MRSPALLRSRRRPIRRSAAALAGLLLAFASQAGGQTAGASGAAPVAPLVTAAPAVLPPLPPVPRLQLALARPTTGAWRREWSLGLSYWRDGTVPEEWRYSTDAELRLEVPTARLELGRWSFTSQLEMAPGRERDCLPDCRAPGWSSSLRLKYDTGDVGPLRQTGPQLELEGSRLPGPRQQRRFFGAGVSGSF